MNFSIALAAVLAFSSGTATISLSGAVNNPGEIAVAKATPLRSILKQRGGVRSDGDGKKILVLSADGKTRVLDITRFDQDQTIRPGDTVSVPIMNPNDYVLLTGAVQNPGLVDYRQGMDLLTLVKEAGLPQGVGSDRVRLTRTDDGVSKTRILNLDKVERGLEANVVLQPADRVEVPYMRQQTSDRQLVTILVVGLLVILLLR